MGGHWEGGGVVVGKEDEELKILIIIYNDITIIQTEVIDTSQAGKLQYFVYAPGHNNRLTHLFVLC